MADPLEQLRAPATPLAPDPAFATALRRTLEAALGVVPSTTIPRRTAMSTATTTEATPYLTVHDAAAALDFYQRAFGAVEVGARYVEADGRIGHAEFTIGGAAFMLADEFPDYEAVSPRTLGGSTTMIHLQVADVDAMVASAEEAGAELLRGPADEPYGRRAATVRDPFGHRWNLNTPLAADGSPPPWRGRVAYFTMAVPDAVRAQAFWGGLLGWGFAPGSVAEGFQIAGPTSPPGGVHGGQERAAITVHFAVEDIDAAVARVRELGGEATAPERHPSGGNASCHDDQGVAFDLFEPRPGYEP